MFLGIIYNISHFTFGLGLQKVIKDNWKFIVLHGKYKCIVVL